MNGNSTTVHYRILHFFDVILEEFEIIWRDEPHERYLFSQIVQMVQIKSLNILLDMKF